MVLPDGSQTQCPVIVVQAGQAPAQAQAVPPPPPVPAPAPAPAVQQAYPGYYPAQAPRRRLRRHRERYTPGMTLPPGGQIVERRHYGLLIPGIAIFAAHYLSVAFYGLSTESYDDFDSKNYIPVLGPLLTLDHADYHSGRSIRIYDSLMQGVGLALFLIGMHKTAYVEWRADSGVQRNFALVPGASPDGGALNAMLRF